MSGKPRRKLRCAIYTRKSSDEGLEQDFNSLDAQREACEAYIVSQKHEGWTCLPDQYDDGGISGATLERPALQQLLSDIRARKVDVVVVYKVDRLTRALADFAKIVEIFDSHKVSFVSVTQQFNTTSSMGRLTLNVLLSFAQFEREVTAERIRDKIAASKKKGMWMGGTVPLGYDARDRTLIINEPEAETVRMLFRLYLELGNVRLVTEEANRRGLRTKLRENLNSRMRGGRPFSRGHIYNILTNPVYIGRVPHKKETYPGLHPAIIDQETWTTVQRMMDGHRVDRRNGTNARHPSPLAGKLFDDKGTPFTPTHAVKHGKRYRYYVEREAVRPAMRPSSGAGSRPRHRRIAAGEIEGVVMGALRHLFQSPARLIDVLGLSEASATLTRTVTSAAARLADSDAGADSPDHHRLLRELVTRVALEDREVNIRLSRTHLRAVLGLDDGTVAEGAEDIDVTVPIELRPRGVELRFVIRDPTLRPAPKMDVTLITATVRARGWLDQLMNGAVRSLREIALRENLHERYVRRVLELAFLAPDITEAILDGRQPADLMLQEIIPDGALPLDWSEQRKLLRIP